MRHCLLITASFTLAACSLRGGLAAAPTATPLPPTATAAATATPTIPPPTATATLTPLPTLAPPTATATPTEVPALEHFLLVGRPVPPHASLSAVASYRYGSTNEGRYDTHHGVEFANPYNTQLIAAAPGTVQWAGDDLGVLYGPFSNFYGILVVLQLDERWQGHTVYALYGHMLGVDVAPGEHVDTGRVLGWVGQTGVALGPHLHLEVRLDNPTDYYSTRNPELWLQPLPGTGLLAGAVRDRRGQHLRDARVTIDCSDGQRRFVDTYHDETVTPDEVYDENYAIGDVYAGTCALSTDFLSGTVRQVVTVAEGALTLVDFVEP